MAVYAHSTSPSPSSDPTLNKPIPTVLCSNCGTYCPVVSGQNVGSGDERRIAELEAQLMLMKRRAAETEEKLAEYQESDPRKSTPFTAPPPMTNSPIIPKEQNLPPAPAIAPAPAPAPAPSTPLFQTRFGSLLGSGSSRNPSITGTRELDLAQQLAKEQDLRQQAEGKVSALSTEMEDLSVTLFQQANEMVATERRARAKLEERVEILEKRDSEKKKRLDRLEKALLRIERVKGLLAVEYT